ncbi:MAG TPA: GNAT family N-acetyltransferase [Acidimicrobiia bacterium]|nr:GNAT family N-acetyltransferase [Acidimicrobiia bacterium]
MDAAALELTDGTSVRLRLVVDADLDAVYDGIAGDADIERYTRIPFPYTRELAREFIERSVATRADGDEYAFAIRTFVDDALVGGIGVHRIGRPAPPDSALLPNEVGYWVRADARGRGLCTSALRVLSRWALTDLGVDRLELQCATDNARSRRVAEKVGYRFTRTVTAAEVVDDHRDHHRFVLTLADLDGATAE